MSFKTTLQKWIKSKMLWIGLIILSLSMEGVALYYQYVLNEPPCILCIHFRLLFISVIIFSIIGLLTRHSKVGNIISLLGIVGSFGFMTERAYQLLGTERLFISGECGFGLNFPDWIAVDKWIPAFFEPMTSCGYTPEVMFGITMAEALMVFTIVMTLFSIWAFVVALSKRTISY